MSGRVLQQLFEAGEYDEFDDIIIVEGEFIEFDSAGCAVRQAILGISPFHLVKADRRISDYKKEPKIFFDTDADPYLDGLEILSIVPLCLITISYSSKIYEVEVDVNGNQRYYLLCNTQFNGYMEETWARWVRRIQYIRNDPYHYIRNMLDEHNIPYPEHYQELELKEALETTVKVGPKQNQEENGRSIFSNNFGEFFETEKAKEDQNLSHGQVAGKGKKHGRPKKEKLKGKKKTIFSWKYLYLKRKRR